MKNLTILAAFMTCLLLWCPFGIAAKEHKDWYETSTKNLSYVWNNGGKQFCGNFATGFALNIAAHTINYQFAPILDDKEKQEIAKKVFPQFDNKVVKGTGSKDPTDEQLIEYCNNKRFFLLPYFSSCGQSGVLKHFENDVKLEMIHQTHQSTATSLPISSLMPLYFSLHHYTQSEFDEPEELSRSNMATFASILGWITAQTLVSASEYFDKNPYYLPKDLFQDPTQSLRSYTFTRTPALDKLSKTF